MNYLSKLIFENVAFVTWQVIYTIHSLFSFTYKNLHSPVDENLFIEIGNVCRRQSKLIDDLTLCIDYFTQTLNYILHMLSKRSYITGDFNIDLLKINRNTF